jgi:hypothetical protein
MPYLVPILALLLGLLNPASSIAQTDPNTEITAKGGKLYLTTSSTSAGMSQIQVADYRYDRGVFTVSNLQPIADGIQGFNSIEFNPRNKDLLLGDNGQNVASVHRGTGELVQSFRTPRTGQRISVLSADRLARSGQSVPSIVTISDRGLGPAHLLQITGEVNPTLFIPTPQEVYFTKATGTSPGRFGKATFRNDYQEATLDAYYTGLLSARGGVYDPYTDSVILMGLSEISQLPANLPDPGNPNPSPPYVSHGDLRRPLGISDLNFFQGAVDGQGHLFAASLSGHLVFIDYSQTRKVVNAENYMKVVPIPNLSDVEVAPGRPFQGPEEGEAEH